MINPNGDFWSFKFTVLYTLLALAYCYHLGSKIHWSVGVASLSPLLGTIYVGLNKFSHYNTLSLFDQIAFQKSALITGFTFLIVTWFFSEFNTPRKLKVWPPVLGAFCLIDSLVTIVQVLIGTDPMGFIGNPSMNACLISVTLPFIATYILTKRKTFLLLLVLPLSAIVLCSSTMGWLTLVVVFFFYFFKTHWKIVPLVGIPLIGIALSMPEFFGDSGRFHIWKICMEFWSVNFNPLFGSGPGLAFNYVSYIQRVLNEAKDDTIWLWLHSDWIQILFEHGVLGLVGVGIFYGSALIKASRSPVLLSTWVGYGFMGLANYPLRLPVHVAVGCILTMLIFRGDK